MRLTINQMDKLIELLELKQDEKGEFSTNQGKVTWELLREIIESVINQ